MFGDETGPDGCAKPDCVEDLASAAESHAAGATDVDGSTPEPPAAPSVDVDIQPGQAQLPVRSLEDQIDHRQLLWSEIDGAKALFDSIQSGTHELIGAIATSVVAHARLTTGHDLLTELRTVESELNAEMDNVSRRASTIDAHSLEIARLKRNRLLLIAAIVIGVIVVIAVIAQAVSS